MRASVVLVGRAQAAAGGVSLRRFARCQPHQPEDHSEEHNIADGIQSGAQAVDSSADVLLKWPTLRMRQPHPLWPTRLPSFLHQTNGSETPISVGPMPGTATSSACCERLACLHQSLWASSQRVLTVPHHTHHWMGRRARAHWHWLQLKRERNVSLLTFPVARRPLTVVTLPGRADRRTSQEDHAAIHN